MASDSAILYDGDIIQSGDTADVYQRPNHVKSGEFFSDPPMNFLPCTVSDGQAVVADAIAIPLADMEATDLADGGYILGIRPHHLRSESNLNPDREFVPITANLSLSELVGSDVTLHLSRGENSFIALTQEFRQFELGEEITVYIDPRRVHVFDENTNEVVKSAAAVRKVKA